MRHDDALEAQGPAAPVRVRRRRVRALARALVRAGLERVIGSWTRPWAVEFAGRRLVLPPRREFGPAWIAATGFAGDEPETHALYEGLVRGPRPPRVFFDVGAGYGLRSLELLAHGVRTVSFEPNEACHPFFLACCRLNNVRPDLRSLAVGRAPGRVALRAPSRQWWRGTTAPHVALGGGDGAEVETRLVRQVALDDVVKADRLVPDVVTIDTGGSELSVLAGAQAMLAHARPLVVLESWPASPDRVVLFELLASYGYRLSARGAPAFPAPALTLHAFVDSPATTFAARTSAPPAALPDRRRPE
jgi:FkbM family methyltransferase